MFDAFDLMEAELEAREDVREMVAAFMRDFTAPLAEVARIKSMLAAGQPGPGATDQHLKLARRVSMMARGEQGVENDVQ